MRCLDAEELMLISGGFEISTLTQNQVTYVIATVAQFVVPVLFSLWTGTPLDVRQITINAGQVGALIMSYEACNRFYASFVEKHKEL